METIKTEIINNSIFHVILNRPSKLNSMTKLFFIEFKNAFKSVKNNQEIRVVLISAEGKAFSSGIDCF